MLIADDTEGWPNAPWSLQFARKAGEGFLIRATDTAGIAAFFEMVRRESHTLLYHSALHDRAMNRALARLAGFSEEEILFTIDAIPFEDTMILAYLLQLEPQGLKPLATRHANMPMMEYDEVMGDAQNRLALDWLQGVWDCEQEEYVAEQMRAMAKINATPLCNPDGTVKRVKVTGEIRYRKITKPPSLPKSALFKAVERCMRAKDPARLWRDQVIDVQVAGRHVLGDMPRASLSHVEFEGEKGALRYGCRDADATHRVYPELLKRAQRLGLEDVYRLELSTYPLIDRMATIGLKPDLKVFADLSQKLDFEIADLQVAIEGAVGREGFNANSGDQVGTYLYEHLKLPIAKMTGTGDRGSTNDKILEGLEKEFGLTYPEIKLFREYREVYKLKHTFVDQIPDFVHRWPFDGRVHATFRTTRVITGRLAASDPNVLAQPEHGKFAKDFKAGWVAEEGHLIGNWDLSQVELRVLAHLSGDPVLMEAYLFKCPHESDWQSGKAFCKRDGCVLKGDLHARLAHQMFAKLPSQQDDSEHRLPSKAVNFGIPMGMTCFGLAIELKKNGVDADEIIAQEWLDATNKLYKRVPRYKAEKIAEAKRLGYVRCLSGRIRYIGGIRSKDDRLRSEAERFAGSTPIQEGAQWCMKQAEAFIWNHVLMPRYRDGYYKGGPRGRWIEPLLQVHDALKMEVAEGLEQGLHQEMVHAMTKVPKALSVPLGVDGKVGINMRDMRKL